MLFSKSTCTLIVLFFNIYLVSADPEPEQPIDTSLYSVEFFPKRGYDLYMENGEKGFQYFNEAADYFKSKNDTTLYLRSLLGLSDLQMRKGQYNESFDILWSALDEYKNSIDNVILQQLHRRLGMLYGIYGKDSLAIFHLEKALSIVKGIEIKRLYNTAYFSIAEQYIKMSQYDKALKYLDSCYLTTPLTQRLIYVDAYYGLAYIRNKDFKKAKFYLRQLIPEFEKENLAFKAKVYSIQADLKIALNEIDSGIYYLQKSLITIDSLQVHAETKPHVLGQLAELHFGLGQNEQAYKYMKWAKEASDSLFNTQSKRNSALFEIKNKYKEDNIKKSELIETQNKMLKLSDKASLRLKLLIGFMVIAGIVLFLMLRQKNRIKQIVYEQKVSKQKNDEVLEIKNKELTVNALQLIEKETAIDELLNIIKGNSPTKYGSIAGRHKQNNQKIWEDFHHRFTQVNSNFYKVLLERHPALTQTDLKHCALIRLKFDSKEMAQILGISVNSVHMARSRIRKKIDLQRADSLSGYLAAF